MLILFAILLQLDWDWSKIIGYTLAIVSGVVLGISIEIKEGTFSKKAFFLRLMQVFGLGIITYYVWKFYITKIDFIFALFAISLFSDTIVSAGHKIGKMGITGYFKYLAGQIPQDKERTND